MWLGLCFLRGEHFKGNYSNLKSEVIRYIIFTFGTVIHCHKLY